MEFPMTALQRCVERGEVGRALALSGGTPAGGCLGLGAEEGRGKLR